ncbi:MAG: Bax inhibitor-1/YccA family protein [Bacteroidales bacterium]|nr:Bax inhibitor-1/YccA family protein [Bacteroidales bacterium]MDD3665548.1 Bax inhibitor-1/YccA family protein [Bacteroidales bacterium]
MFVQNQNPYAGYQNVTRDNAFVTRTFMSGVFSWMAIALAISAFTAYLFASTPSLIGLLVGPQGMTILGWIVMFAPIGFVLLMSFKFNTMSASTLALLFGVYAVLMGASLSFIFLIYTIGSIAQTFVIATGMFGLMAVVGYTTKTDLTRFGSLMMMGLIGIVIASLVNIILGSSTMDYVISIIGVLVFTGLTAYDVQKLKNIGAEGSMGGEMAKKVKIMGALTLYLDFINLFLFLLRFFGSRRD